jgi:hypothetical protein
MLAALVGADVDVRLDVVSESSVARGDTSCSTTV